MPANNGSTDPKSGAGLPAGIDVPHLLRRLEALHPRKIDLSLDRIERLLATLGNPQEALPPVIHVAGTNGKGSVIAFLRAILEAAGARVHAYVSPHLLRFNERILLAGDDGMRPISDGALTAVLLRAEQANGASRSPFSRSRRRRPFSPSPRRRPIS